MDQEEKKVEEKQEEIVEENVEEKEEVIKAGAQEEEPLSDAEKLELALNPKEDELSEEEAAKLDEKDEAEEKKIAEGAEKKVEEKKEEKKDEEIKDEKPSAEEIKKKVETYQNAKNPDKAIVDPLANMGMPKADKEKAAKIAQEYADTQDPLKLVELISAVGQDIANNTVMGILKNEATTKADTMRRASESEVYTKYPELIDVARADEKANKEGMTFEEAYGGPAPEICLVMNELYQKHPNLLRVPEGPSVCMAEAEKIMAAKPVEEKKEVVEEKKVVEKPQKSEAEIREEETKRQNGVRAAAAISSGQSGGYSGEGTDDEELTEAQIELCQDLGISTAGYKKRMKNRYIHNADYYKRNKTTAIRKSNPSDGGAQ